MHAFITTTWQKRLRAIVLLSLLLPAPLAAQPAALTSPGISHGYTFPRSQQGAGDLYGYVLGDPAYEQRYAVLNGWGIGIGPGGGPWWENLELPGSQATNGAGAGRVVTSSTSPMSCPGGYFLFPADQAQKTALNFWRFHCYNTATRDLSDAVVLKNTQSGMQSGTQFFATPVMHRHYQCTGPQCLPYDPAGWQDLDDYMAYVAWRWNGTHGVGKISHFIFWNEVDEGGYFDMTGWGNPFTGLPMNQTTPTAQDKAFWTALLGNFMRNAHAMIQRHSSSAMLYVSLTGLWSQQARPSGLAHIGGRYIVDQMWSELGTSYDWSIAFHPYLDPVNDGVVENINFAELNGTVIQYQKNALISRALNPDAYPQSYVWAQEQGWPKTDVLGGDGNVLLPGVGINGQARNICLAHSFVASNSHIIATTHNNFQEHNGYPWSVNIALIPASAGIALDGALAAPTFKAYEATGVTRWGKSDLHYCCVNHNVGCKNTPQPSTSVAGSGKSELPDFTGDGFADYAEQATNGNAFNWFYIHRNLQNGFFTLPGNDWGSGYATSTAGWEVLIADFTGDGRADFADVNKATGEFYLHWNAGNGTFEMDPGTWYGFVYGGPDVEFFAGDFDGDGRADVASRNVRTGYIAIRRNVSAGLNSFGQRQINFQDYAVNAGPSATSPEWRTVVADLNGDNKADFIDHHLTSGQLWRHLNISAPGTVFDPAGFLMGTSLHGAGWTTLFGDFNGDGSADYADLFNPGNGTGSFWMHLNQGNSFDALNYGHPTDPIATGGVPTWRILGGQP